VVNVIIRWLIPIKLAYDRRRAQMSVTNSLYINGKILCCVFLRRDGDAA